MIDLSKIAYRLTVMDSGGKQYNIKEFVTGLGWEENKNEISVRTSFTAKNDKTSAGRLSELIKPGCLIGIFASDGGKQDREVARGTVQEWNPQEQSSSNTLKALHMILCMICRGARTTNFIPQEPVQNPL